MPRYAKFLFAILISGILLSWMSIALMLYFQGIPDLSTVVGPITPVVSTQVPSTSTPAPTDSTPAPTESTPAPTDATPAPTDATPAPTDATAAPTDSTAAPTEPTSTAPPQAAGTTSTPTSSPVGPTSTSVATSTPVEPSPVPSGLTVAQSGESFVRLRWFDLGDQVEEFVIYYSTDDFSYLNHGAVPANRAEYMADALACDTTYYFRIHPRTVDQTWLEASNTVTVQTGACPATATPTSPPAATSIETATPANTVVVSCADLERANSATQILIVESGNQCAPYFVNLLEQEPARYLAAFYALISSTSATDALFTAVYDELVAKRFQFPAEVVDNLLLDLPPAVGACVDHRRCEEWSKFILPALSKGDFYDCPDVSTLNEAQLLERLPYTNYACTEEIAKALATQASEKTISTLLETLSTDERDWSRRNAVRTLGRLGQQPETEQAHILLTQTYSTTVQSALVSNLEKESTETVLHDTIWLLDTLFFPFLPMQPNLQAITSQKELESSVRFRALSSISRLIQAKEGLIGQSDLDFLTGLLQSDDVWMRAQAGFALEVLQDEQLDSVRREFITQALDEAWTDEEKVMAKAYMARALDRYQDSHLHDRLREEYELEYLANSMSGDRTIIRSGLPQDELPAFITLMVNGRRAFFDFMGLSFDSHVPGDLNDMITLILFANKEEYREYMNAFIGYGANAGGLYLEKEGILYTYQREPGQSRYTVEELVKHEFSHYLQGRYIFPGLWTDPTYHQEIKGWADEGLAEFFAGFTFDESGNYTYSARDTHLDTLCGVPHRDLTSLLTQSEGYNQTGTFDYANGWSFIFYMMTNRSDSIHRLFESFRDDTYTLEKFGEISGVPISNLQQEWHNSLDWWCTVTDKDGTSEADFTHGYSADGSPFGDTNENIIIHLPDGDAPPELFDLPLESE